MIRRTLETSIELTAEELADEFLNMDARAQASFFSLVGTMSKDWKNPLAMQLWSIVNSPAMTSDGLYVMLQIGEYARSSK